MQAKNIVKASALLATFVAGAVVATAATTYETLLSKSADAIVTVKFIPEMQGRKMQEQEISGFVVTSDGMVICSAALMGQRESGPSIVANEIKVLAGDDTEGLEAIMVSKDTKRDLVWLQIIDEIEKPMVAIDLANSTEVVPGNAIYSVTRMNRYFGFAPYVLEGTVTGVVKKPREMLIPSITLSLQPGLPVFAADGKTVGMLVVQMPDQEAMAAASSNLKPAIMVLSAKKIAGRTEEAKREVPAAKERAAKEKAEREAKEAAEKAAQEKAAQEAKEKAEQGGDAEQGQPEGGVKADEASDAEKKAREAQIRAAIQKAMQNQGKKKEQ